MADYTIPVDVQQVLADYSERFKEAAEKDTTGLTVFEHAGQRYLMPSMTHAIWCKMQYALTPADATKIAEEFLASTIE